MATYDTYYQTEDLFGDPYPELISYLGKYIQDVGSHHDVTLLDVGCGQGRNAIALARIGYQVTGIDISKVGIAQMLERAEAEKLPVKGAVEDIYAFDTYNSYDVILLDSMFHFYAKDKKQETDLVRKIMSEAKFGCLICVCIAASGKKVQILKGIFDEFPSSTCIHQEAFQYKFMDESTGHQSASDYEMWVEKK
jgi:SAM-dependent methyltransferase